MKSWNGAVNGVVPATAASTLSSPRTSRLTAIPCLALSASSMGPFLSLPGLASPARPAVRVERRVGERARRAEVTCRVERRLDLLRGDPRLGEAAGRLRVLQQRVAQRAAGPGRARAAT